MRWWAWLLVWAFAASFWALGFWGGVAWGAR